MFTTLTTLTCLAISLAAETPAVEIKVITFNVLVEISAKPGVPSWKDRRELCVQVLKEKDPDLIGLQEPMPTQVQFFLGRLEGYADVQAENYPDATLLYKKATFDELERGHWWLSPTPEKRSRGFGNFLPRILVWAKLRHKATGREIYVFNTHFDNSMPSQVKMAELCEKKMKPFLDTGLPMIFMGDFNTDQKRGDYARLTSNGWRDSYRVSKHASSDGRDDNVPTILGNVRIDHVFHHGKEWTPISWERLESPDPQKLLSDHYPVFVVLKLQ